MSKLFIVAEVRDWLNQLGNEEISFSKFVELFNEKAASQPYPRWVNGNKRLPSISNEDFPKEYLIRVKGDDPRSGWVHTEYITAESMRDIKEDWWEWLEETPSIQEGEESKGDAVEFIGWIVDEGYEVHSKDAWMKINDNADFAPVLNRQQLYQLFQTYKLKQK